MVKLDIIKELKSQKKQYQILTFVMLFLLIGSSVLSVSRGIKRDECQREFKEFEDFCSKKIGERDRKINNLTEELLEFREEQEEEYCYSVMKINCDYPKIILKNGTEIITGVGICYDSLTTHCINKSEIKEIV